MPSTRCTLSPIPRRSFRSIQRAIGPPQAPTRI
jgi:hypothetical protein